MAINNLLALLFLLFIAVTAGAAPVPLGNGGFWIGPLSNQQPNGFGKAIYPDGTVLFGHSAMGSITGLGRVQKPVGTFEGDLLDGKAHGVGRNSGPVFSYIGEYRDDHPKGVGVYKESEFSYRGGMDNWKYSGFGVMEFQNGNRLVGEFKNGKSEGFASFDLASGEAYSGYFKNGLRHGPGINYYADGRIESGIWRKDILKRERSVNIERELRELPEKERQLSVKLAALEVLVAEKLKFLDDKVNEFLGSGESSPNSGPRVSPEASAEEESDKLYAASSGSGFFVSSDGHLITNNHVIEQCSSVKVLYQGELFGALVLARDTTNDLALLKGNFAGQSVLPISKENPFLLQDIYAAGFPFGNSVSSSVKVTKGIVSSLAGLADNFSNLQIDAALQPGNSGGPIVDDYGNVVAVAVAKLDLKSTVERFGVVPENTNFGIKATVVRNLLDANAVPLPKPSKEILEGGELGQRITNGTVYLSCLMTLAQIERTKDRKVLFKEFD